jgi:S1-C subfamily serine protease
MSVLEELGQAVSGVAGRVGPAVVGIGRGWGLGSGVVIGEGLVLTNAHNLSRSETAVTFADGRTETGQVRGVDADGDLALLAVDTAGVTPVEWAPQAEAVAVGTPVFALANPGGRGVRSTFGLVSATNQSFRGPRGRRIAGSVEHTAPLARGSSGGPVVDAQGRLLGINTSRLGEGFYLAIPADDELRARIDALGRGEAPVRVRLGVGIAPARQARQLRRAVGLPDREGLLVRMLEEDGPAHRAGIRTGDLLVAANGRALASSEDLYEVLDGLAPGGALTVQVVRGTEELTLAVTFGETREEGSA